MYIVEVLNLDDHSYDVLGAISDLKKETLERAIKEAEYYYHRYYGDYSFTGDLIEKYPGEYEMDANGTTRAHLCIRFLKNL